MSSVDKKLTYLIVEKKILPTIFQPLKSNRIKYTCFEVSYNFLILGATSGGLYIFKRDPCIFLQLVPNKEGPINSISLTSDEKLIAFSTLKGVTCVLELYDGNDVRVINRSVEHCGSLITSLVWANTTNQLYVGDNLGRLSVINVSLFMNKNIFHIPAYMFMQLDSAVVQISCFKEYLLVSTKTRCYICDTTQEKYKQIGTQLRDGLYGATFLNSTNGLKIYCARPGSRLWEADVSGSVKSTHQFKKALATQSVAVVKLEENVIIQKLQPSWPDQSFNFCLLMGIFDKYLFTFKSDGIYIFDPITAEVILWSDHYKDIVDAKCVNDIVYLWTSLGQMHSFVITPLNKCLVQLYFLGKYQLCVDVLERFIDHAKSFSIMSKVTCLVGLKDQFPNITKNAKLSSYLENLITSVKDKHFSSNLDSGIFLVDNKHWKKWKLSIKNSKSTKKKAVVRSHSLSDLNNLSKKSTSAISKGYNISISLPDMQFSIEEAESTPTNNHKSYESTLLWNASLTGLFMQQIPFLSLTSPDLIQSTIVELGQNVKRTLSMSTKSLQNKLQFLEDKIKTPKESYHTDSSEAKHKYINNYYKNNENIVINDTGYEENIVFQPTSTEPKKETSIDISDICITCDKIMAGEKISELAYHLFDTIIEKTFKFNELSSPDDNSKKPFPFRQLLNPRYIDIVQCVFHDSFKYQYIINYLNSVKKFNLNFLDNQEHPYILKRINHIDDLNNDLILSNIMFIFSEILDPHTILQYLEGCKLPCIFLSWSIVLDIFQDEAFSFFATKKDSPLNYFECPLPFLLNMLFLMLRLEQIESSCHMAMKVKLKLFHISYLIMKLSLHFEYTGIHNHIDKCNKLLLNYVLCLINSRSFNLKDLSDPETLYHLEFAFTLVNKSTLHNCRCHYPLVGNTKVTPKYPEIGRLLMNIYLLVFKRFNNSNSSTIDMGFTFKFTIVGVDFLSSSEKTLGRNYIEMLPERHKFCIEFLNHNVNKLQQNNDIVNINLKIVYSRIICLVCTMPDLMQVVTSYFIADLSLHYIPFLVQFNQIDEIPKIKCKNALELWRKVFDLNLSLSNGECCICNHNNLINIKVDWNRTCVIALKCLGSSDTLKLMMAYADLIPSEEIDGRFFRIFFLRHYIQQDNDKNLFLIDVFCDKLKTDENDFVIKKSSSRELFNEIVDEGALNSHAMEIDVNNDLCCLCSLLLSSDKVFQKGRVRAFHCKHIYHIACLRHANSLFECPLCIRMRNIRKK